jgi:hypothetical protein
MSCRADFNIRPFFASGEAAGLYFKTCGLLAQPAWKLDVKN